jgi:hypothetical protein
MAKKKTEYRSFLNVPNRKKVEFRNTRYNPQE